MGTDYWVASDNLPQKIGFQTTEKSSLADLGGVSPFRFDIQNFRNVTASGVNAPLRGRCPPTGNPGSATGVDCVTIKCPYICYVRASHGSYVFLI